MRRKLFLSVAHPPQSRAYRASAPAARPSAIAPVLGTRGRYPARRRRSRRSHDPESRYRPADELRACHREDRYCAGEAEFGKAPIGEHLRFRSKPVHVDQRPRIEPTIATTTVRLTVASRCPPPTESDVAGDQGCERERENERGTPRLGAQPGERQATGQARCQSRARTGRRRLQARDEQRQEKRRRVDGSAVSPLRLGGCEQRQIPRSVRGNGCEGRSRTTAALRQLPDVTTRCRLDPAGARQRRLGRCDCSICPWSVVSVGQVAVMAEPAVRPTEQSGGRRSGGDGEPPGDNPVHR